MFFYYMMMDIINTSGYTYVTTPVYSYFPLLLNFHDDRNLTYIYIYK